MRLTAWYSHGNMARLDDALALSRATGQLPDPAAVRRFATRAGAGIDVEQEATSTLGLFLRASFADGRYEAFEFTDVDRSLSGGLSLKGSAWGRAGDRLGIGIAVNGASAARERFLAAGGLGILVGDGRLPRPGAEDIVETWYDLGLSRHLHASADFQLIRNPGYDRDRGPVAVLGARLHAQF